jgi:hypothetical protein
VNTSQDKITELKAGSKPFENIRFQIIAYTKKLGKGKKLSLTSHGD